MGGGEVREGTSAARGEGVNPGPRPRLHLPVETSLWGLWAPSLTCQQAPRRGAQQGMGAWLAMQRARPMHKGKGDASAAAQGAAATEAAATGHQRP